MSLRDIGKDCEITLTEPNGKTSSWIANSVTAKTKEPIVKKLSKKKWVKAKLESLTDGLCDMGGRVRELEQALARHATAIDTNAGVLNEVKARVDNWSLLETSVASDPAQDATGIGEPVPDESTATV